jgi:hypothetical protein
VWRSWLPLSRGMRWLGWRCRGCEGDAPYPRGRNSLRVEFELSKCGNFSRCLVRLAPASALFFVSFGEETR